MVWRIAWEATSFTIISFTYFCVYIRIAVTAILLWQFIAHEKTPSLEISAILIKAQFLIRTQLINIRDVILLWIIRRCDRN